ncbi:MAG: ShET2/EspL2 family type III secretion system effector toxin [Coxiellaceae bacterium]|nr:ShET2/EspL2 family type III secretion system effector toxin [Coxiellaceae bacterium]
MRDTDVNTIRLKLLNAIQAKRHEERIKTLYDLPIIIQMRNQLICYLQTREKLEQQERQFIDYGDILVVTSKGDPTLYLNQKVHFNGDTKAPLVECREFCLKQLQYHNRSDRSAATTASSHDQPIGYNDLFSTPEQIAETFTSETYNSAAAMACASQGITASTQGNGIGMALHHLCKNLPKNAEKLMTLNSGIHMMSIVVKHRTDGLVIIKFYDPYHTGLHLKLILKNTGTLQQITLQHLSTPTWKHSGTSSHEMKSYFRSCKTLSLLEYTDLPRLTRHGESEILLLHATSDLKEKAEQLNIALASGYTTTVIELTDEFLDMDATEAFNGLSHKNNANTAGFYLACSNGNTKTVAIFTRKILNSHTLSESDKRLILQSNTLSSSSDDITFSAAQVASFYQRHDTQLAFIAEILSARSSKCYTHTPTLFSTRNADTDTDTVLGDGEAPYEEAGIRFK